MIQREWKKKKIERKASPKESCARQITRPLGLAPSGNIRTGVYFHAHQLPFGAPILVSNGVLSHFIYYVVPLPFQRILSVFILTPGCPLHFIHVPSYALSSGPRPLLPVNGSGVHPFTWLSFSFCSSSHRPPVSVPAGLAVSRWRRWT